LSTGNSKSDVPGADTALSSLLHKLAWILAAISAQSFFVTEKYAVAFTSGGLGLTFYFLAVKYPVMSRRSGNGWFLQGLQRIATNRTLRNAVLLICIGYIVVTAFIDIRSVRSDLNMFVMPRMATNEQAKTIREHLRPNRDYPLTVRYNVRDLESAQYGAQLQSAITSANWRATQPKIFEDPASLDEGIAITAFSDNLSNDDPVRQGAGMLRKALCSAGIEANEGWARSDEKKIVLSVGHRPLRIIDQHDLLHTLNRWFNRASGNCVH
jgi:hypothetical protein